MYHGLDEIGAGTAFYLNVERGLVWSLWQGDANGLYRRPTGSQGELKTSGDLKASIGRKFHQNLDLEAVFQGDFYQFERFEGPSPLFPTTTPPPGLWKMPGQPLSSAYPLQRIERSLVGLGGTFKPDTLLTLSSIIGQQWERREGFDDQGLSASLAAELAGFEYKGYRNNLDLYLEQEELGDRSNRELRFNYGLNKAFSQNSADRLEVYYRQKRQDYHIWGTSAIGTRMDTDQSIRNQLRYNIESNLAFFWDTQLLGSTHEDRSPTANAIREEVNTASSWTLQGQKDHTSGWGRVKIDWGVQEDATGLKRERGTSLEGGFSWFPTYHDSLAFLSAVRKRQYDTSDTANYDDRDRLRYEFDLLYGHKFSSTFRVYSHAEVTLEHLVYIFGEKSDQNHWNRIFKLKPEVSFEPYWGWHNCARFELVANSTDYDFELDPAFIKSSIYRRYTAADSLAWEITPGWALSLDYTIGFEDGGRFLWDEWIQQISEEYRTQQMRAVFIRRTPAGIHFDAGVSLYERKGWEYKIEPGIGTVKTPFMYLSRWGPLLQLTYPSVSGLSIRAVGDLSWVHEWDKNDYTIVNLDLRVTWQ